MKIFVPKGTTVYLRKNIREVSIIPWTQFITERDITFDTDVDIAGERLTNCENYFEFRLPKNDRGWAYICIAKYVPGIRVLDK